MKTRWQHKKPAKPEQQVAEWNLYYPIGTKVTYESPTGEIRMARTVSGAFLMEFSQIPTVHVREDSKQISIPCPLALIRPKGGLGHA